MSRWDTCPFALPGDLTEKHFLQHVVKNVNIFGAFNSAGKSFHVLVSFNKKIDVKRNERLIEFISR